MSHETLWLLMTQYNGRSSHALATQYDLLYPSNLADIEMTLYVRSEAPAQSHASPVVDTKSCKYESHHRLHDNAP